MSLTTHPTVKSMRAERDVEQRMADEVPADGTFVVIDGSPADAEVYGDRLTVCTCDDGKHHRLDRYDRWFKTDEQRYAQNMANFQYGHVVPVRLYLVVGEVEA